MQNKEYLSEIKNDRTKIYSTHRSLVAACSPFNSKVVVIVGVKGPVVGILIAAIVPDPTYPKLGKYPYGVFFPPNETGKKSLITFEGIRRAFGMTIWELYEKLTGQRFVRHKA